MPKPNSAAAKSPTAKPAKNKPKPPPAKSSTSSPSPGSWPPTDGKLPAGIRITNGKRLYNIGGLAKTGSAQYAFAGGKTTVENYTVKRGDDTVNYAFAPAFGNIPAKISYIDNGTTYNLKLTGLKINGQTVKP